MKLIIYSPERTVFDGEVELVELPGTKGRFTVLKDHEALISTLQQGFIRYVSNGEESRLDIKSGYVEVKQNVIQACILGLKD